MSVKIANIELGNFPLLLAPMEDVSDPPFRALCKREGCDVMYTEFISVEGLIRDADKSVQKLDIYEEERPIGIQIFGANEESMMLATDIVCEAKPEILDINFGCPVKNVVNKMAGAGILRDIDRMVSLAAKVVERSSLPVTVKTRLGWDEKTIQIVEVAEKLQDVGVRAISIHGRTRKQMYKGQADWSWIARVKENPRLHIPVFGNGDIKTPEMALEYKNRYGVDGLMIGRASIGNPWIFKEIKYFVETGNHLDPPTINERVEMAREHLNRSLDWKGSKLGILEMRRHYTSYFKGYRDIKPFRSRLVTEYNPAEVHNILDEIKERYSKEELFV